MDRDKLISTLQQVKAIVDEALGEAGYDGVGRKRPTVRGSKRQSREIAISFNMNVLAFMNKHARGLKGSQKFTLLLARQAKGSTTKEMSLGEVKKQWNKMKSVMGGEFNPAHANRAKAKGWVDTPKHGVYTLSASWKDALKNNG